MRSDDLTEIVEQRGKFFVVLRSHAAAESHPEYSIVAIFGARQRADSFLRNEA
jgi:hypothetical protein